MKRIGIIGAPCIDEIISPSGELLERQLGGVLYSYAALARLIHDTELDVEVVPLTHISVPDAEYLQSFLSELPNFNLSHAPRTYDALSNRVKLQYHEDNSRSEFCASILPALTQDHLSTDLLASLDGLFVNMISGFDISLDTLRWIRANMKGYIHLDVHALVLGPLSSDPAHPRIPRGVAHWREWLSNVDSAQLNEMESDWFGVPDTTSEMELLREIRAIASETRAPQSVVITRAERGATSFDFANGKIWNKKPTTRSVKNTTGSGDVFGAVYALSKMLGTPEEQSLWQAEEVAGWNTGLLRLEEILTAPLQIGEVG